MPIVAITALAAVCFAITALQCVLALRVCRRIPPLDGPEASAPPPTPWPKVSIVVPARNEAHGLGAALRSKLACGYPALEVMVVDDRSTDGTGDIARTLAAGDPRAAVTRVDELPADWLGKVHAMCAGAALASGEWLLFSDADVAVAPGTLQRAVAYAEHHGVDMVALMPQMEAVGPVFDSCMAGMSRVIALAGRAWAANDDSSSVAVGVGAFNLVRRRALEATPGLTRLKMEMVDDVALAQMLKASGARCRMFVARRAVHLVFAERLSVLARNMEKGGSLMGFSLTKTLGFAVAWIALDLGIPIAALAAGGTAAILGGAQLALATVTHLVVARHFAWPIRGAWLWPLGTALGIGMLARSGALAWRRQAIVWRGTAYGRAEIEAGRVWSLAGAQGRDRQ